MEERLQKFARLVEYGSFTKASQELHISQPALSLSIAKLERELRTPLLVRSNHGLQLTEAGRAAYAAAKELRTTADNLQLQLAELAQQQLSVSVGMIDSVAACILQHPGTLAELEQQARILIDVDNSSRLQERVRRGRLDAAFVVRQPALAVASLTVTPMGSEPLVLVCHVAQRAELQKTMRHGGLRPFVAYDQQSTTHSIIAQALAAHGLAAQPAFYSTSPDVMLQLVLMQKGAAVLPYLQVRKLVAAGDLCVLELGDGPSYIERPIAHIAQNGRALPAPLERLTIQIVHSLRQLGQEVRQLT